jgi:hypothetical protein
MSVPLHHLSIEPHYSEFDTPESYDDGFVFFPDERIGGPVSRTSDVYAWCVAAVVAVVSCWMLLIGPDAWPKWLPEVVGRISTAIAQATTASDQTADTQSQATQEAAQLPPLTLLTLPPPVQTASAQAVQSQTSPSNIPDATEARDAAPESGEKSAAVDKEGASGEPESSHQQEADAEPDHKAERPSDAYRPVGDEHRPQPRDAMQARAEAVGLHPDFSRAVLGRFSPADFRNARVAIQTAIKKTPDNGTFIWPRQREPGRALFKVRFVAGAPSDCRRYVVSVTMNGWTTTALPMERCGMRRRLAHRD